jgi:folylpolyglutamate synthase/dihydropteroate synthase
MDIAEADNVTSALKQARKVAGPSGLIVVTGSIYVVGEAMRTLGVSI